MPDVLSMMPIRAMDVVSSPLWVATRVTVLGLAAVARVPLSVLCGAKRAIFGRGFGRGTVSRPVCCGTCTTDAGRFAGLGMMPGLATSERPAASLTVGRGGGTGALRGASAVTTPAHPIRVTRPSNPSLWRLLIFLSSQLSAFDAAAGPVA